MLQQYQNQDYKGQKSKNHKQRIINTRERIQVYRLSVKIPAGNLKIAPVNTGMPFNNHAVKQIVNAKVLMNNVLTASFVTFIVLLLSTIYKYAKLSILVQKHKYPYLIRAFRTQK